MLSTIHARAYLDSLESDHRHRLPRMTRKRDNTRGKATPQAPREPSLSSSTSFSLYSVNSSDSTYTYSRATSATISPPSSRHSVSSDSATLTNSTAMSSNTSVDSITPINSAVSMDSTLKPKLKPQPKSTAKSNSKRTLSPAASLRSMTSRPYDESSPVTDSTPPVSCPEPQYKYEDNSSQQNSSSQTHSPTINVFPSTHTDMMHTGSMVDPEFEEAEAARRRRKIDKLTRTLGEDIPTELVFPDLSKKAHKVKEFLGSPSKGGDGISRTKKEKSLRLARRASVSISTFSHLTSLTSILRPSPTIPVSSAIPSPPYGDASPRSNIHPEHDIERRSESRAGMRSGAPAPNTAFIAPVLPMQSPPPISVIVDESCLENPWDGRKTPSAATLTRAKSLSHSPQPLRKYSHSLSEPRPESPFADHLVPLNPNLLAPPESEEEDLAVIRKERRQGWSGEWNRDDMQDVIKKLRSLK